MNRKSVIKNEAFPFILLFSGLFVATFFADFILHAQKIFWIGRTWGYIGTIFIALSFVYTLRKRKLISAGSPRFYLIAHEYLGWFGALMVLVHGGIHYNGLLAWLAMGAMIITVASGLIGRVLLKRSQRTLKARNQAFAQSGLSPGEIKDQLYWDTLAVKAMKKWRAIHFPITTIFVTLSLLHVAAVLYFWDWLK